ncbi:Uncharacterised protein [Mycobacterium tuberculosis]|nr:Uncharacterised protein [Mycobacterium tuberculosis]COW33842.1 Uncharacterised protein [Mycobacterium tuberculosis]
MLVAVLLDKVHLAAELAGDRPNLDLDLTEVLVALMADQLGSRHQRNHLLQVA